MSFADLEGIITRARLLGLDRLIYALLSLALGVIVAKLCRRSLKPIIGRSRIGDDALVTGFLLRSLTAIILVGASLVALSHLGFDVASFVAGLGITGLILGFGLRDTLTNFAAGLLLLIYRPFRAGQLIEVEGTQGVVDELTMMNMQMTSNDGIRIIMPNSKVWGAKIMNYSLSRQRRLEMTIKVPASEMERAMKAISAAFSEDARVLKQPAPLIKVSSVAGDLARLTVGAWTSSDDFGSFGAEAYQKMIAALARAGIQPG
jgi:small conductance mechanosensitive channel